ncbi:putative secreted RxLR effector protein [Phytophthora cinnamomi]|uniref:putative secreted RxLR effector protein n=1 Tax=Phytophthora cinnamomi TaxID=4785 RepID=UPI00355ACB39|nr:putative secreted RxLR effector protein [Phytophthora cinnamomi]
MRVCITLLVAMTMLLADTETVSAATSSGPTKLAQVGSFKAFSNVQSNDARFLRKRDADKTNDLDTEVRGFTLNDVWKKVAPYLSSEQKAKKLLAKTEEQLINHGHGPDDLKNAVKVLEKKKRYTAEQLAILRSKADEWSKLWYRKAGNLDPLRG